ncbi:proteasome activator [[Actinomadura] parvosata]|uniref:proteasome activator n=1 Tax=[Actinomadura] parvosata TaxID=1955412 RepID=UPI00406CD8C0
MTPSPDPHQPDLPQAPRPTVGPRPPSPPPSPDGTSGPRGAASPGGPGGPSGPGGGDGGPSAESALETEIGRVKEPARLLRVSTMARSLLDEARGLTLDEHARDALQHIHTRVVEEIGDSVAPELRDELHRLLPSSSETPTQSEIRIAQSQLVGWLEGVFQGIRVGLTLQQAAPPSLPRPPAPGPGSGPYL